jgi:hypothetical protein
MAIEIPKRKNVKARAIAAENPDLSPAEVAKRAGLDRGAAAKALKAEKVGRDKPKSKHAE